MFSIFDKSKSDPVDHGSGPGSSGIIIRPMTEADIEPAIAVIEAHDEDDAEDAAEAFAVSLENHVVAVRNAQVVGVAGVVFDAEAQTTCWLSRTYVSDGFRRQGIGRALLANVFDALRNDGIHKVFVATGDYVEDGADIYAPAKAFYTAMGGLLEQKVDNYYGPGEATYTYGIDLDDTAAAAADAPPAGYLTFNALAPIDDVADGAALAWAEFTPDTAGEDPAKQLADLIGQAKSTAARFVIAAFPSDLRAGAEHGLAAAGFQPAGELRHYYRPGLHQLHWILRLDG